MLVCFLVRSRFRVTGRRGVIDSRFVGESVPKQVSFESFQMGMKVLPFPEQLLSQALQWFGRPGAHGRPVIRVHRTAPRKQGGKCRSVCVAPG